MNTFLLLGCFLLAVTEYLLGSAHMIPEERLSTNRVAIQNAMSQSLELDPPPVLIEAIPKAVKKKKAKKTKKPFSQNFVVKKRPPPPPNCIPMGGSCKSSDKVCCEFCAFCQCRLFRTVCYCRMGNPSC